jgi:hypothetical protein
MPIILILWGLFSGAYALAGDADARMSQSSQTKTYEISASGDLNSSKNENKDPVTVFSWDMDSSNSKSVATDPTTKIDIEDTTQSATLGMSFERPSHLSAGLDLNYSVTPEEDLETAGPSFTLGYRYYLETRAENFTPYFDFSGSYEISNNNQSFSLASQQRRRGSQPKPLFSNNTIIQHESTLKISVKALSWAKIKGSYSKFDYNKDVAQFLQYIDSPVLAKVSSGINNALAGFYLSTWKVEGDFNLTPDWELELAHSVSQVAVDLSYSIENDLTLYFDLNDSWSFGAGVELSSSTNPDNSSITTTTAKISYYF